LKKYKKIYFDYFNYTEGDFIKCEIPTCTQPAVDIHHIDARGMGGSKLKDVIENLMALCRTHHDSFGDKKQFKQWLKSIHSKVLLKNQKGKF
jgi:predicted restriction endonuclease